MYRVICLMFMSALCGNFGSSFGMNNPNGNELMELSQSSDAKEARKEMIEKILHNTNFENFKNIEASLKEGISQDEKNELLYSAVVNTQCDIVDLLLENGADIYFQKNGKNLLEICDNVTQILILGREENVPTNCYGFAAPHLEQAIAPQNYYGFTAARLETYSRRVNKILKRHFFQQMRHDGQKTSAYLSNWDLFCLATEEGDSVEATYLVDSGLIDVNKANNITGETPLISQVIENNLEMVKWLIQHGADPSIKTKIGTTALSEASRRKHRKVAEYLISNVNVNNQSEVQNAYFYAISLTENESLIKYLIDNGADVHATDNRYPYVLEDIYRFDSGYVRDFINEAREKRKKEFLESIGFNENDVDKVLDNGYTPLNLACRNGEINAVKDLLEKHADVSKLAPNGNTALMEALIHDHVEVAIQLIQHGIDLNYANKSGQTALILSAINNSKLGVHVILQNDTSSIDHQDYSGKNALMYASEYGNTEIVQMLQKAGANLNLRDKDGFGAIDLAERSPHKEIVDMLEKAGAKRNKDLYITPTELMNMLKAEIKQENDLNDLTDSSEES